MDKYERRSLSTTKTILGFPIPALITRTCEESAGCLAKSINQLKSRTQKDITFDFDMDSELPSIKIDEAQMKIALNILLENGIEAMNGEGQLNVSTRFLQKLITDSNSKNGNCALITITDTGGGISSQYFSSVCNIIFALL